MKVIQKHSDMLDKFESRDLQNECPPFFVIDIAKWYPKLNFLSLNHQNWSFILEMRLKKGKEQAKKLLKPVARKKCFIQ